MATLVLGIAGSAVGGALLPGGLSLLGSQLTGASIGGALASIGGGFVDQALLAPLAGASGQTSLQAGPRLSDLKLGSSSEGTPLPRVYGRVRLPGQLIWATRFKEEKHKVKGGADSSKTGAGGDSKSKSVEYRYFANVAYAICEGPITRIGRIWADGKELKQKKFDIAVHLGGETQEPDTLIENKEDEGNAPAYRGTAYVVFNKMPLAKFGNRLPQMNFEVIRGLDGLEERVRAIDLIPGAGEFAYETRPVLATSGSTTAENVHTAEGDSDFAVAIDQLEQLLPNVERVALVVSWFGTDLRIGHCALKPGVETAVKETEPYLWSVGGIARGDAHVVSEHDGRPAYGGTPADASVVASIGDLKARGLGVTFYPFISMDVAEGNSLPNPYGGTGQPAYPWRGRIVCDPAPGEPGTVDETATCASQVASFVGSASASDFEIDGDQVTYSGDPDDWGFRRFILHCAHLCIAAGGVEAFIIGSEMIGATRLRSAASTFPFVNALVTLASDLRALFDAHDLDTKLTYGADWTEHPAYVPADGSGDVYFHLDPLWSSPAIDAIGIDCYWPLADWRDGEDHLDFVPGRAIHDLDYLTANIRGGEAFDFYYPAAGETGNEASPERLAQTRLPITDGAYGKPWVFRPKAIKEWWQSHHYNRPGGVESLTHTGWVPESKPIWFTELGCGAVDKGANQPNVFSDPKSSESLAPFFSRGIRDDLMQRRYIEAIARFFDPDDADFADSRNPSSGVYDGRMVDPARLYIYTWDARPFPAFPYALSVWADGGNWELGHWLNGRIGGGDLGETVRQILIDYGFAQFDVSGLGGTLEGYLIDRIMSAREALQPLSLAYFFDAQESGGLIHFRRRGAAGPLATFTPDDLVEKAADNPLYSLTRGQETELPVSAKLTYIDQSREYAQGAVEARKLGTSSGRVSAAELPIAMEPPRAQRIAESWLRDVWVARERANFALPPSRLALEPTDIVILKAQGRDYRLRLTETRDATFKAVEARSVEPRVFEGLRVPEVTREPRSVPVFGPATAHFLDLPRFRPGDPDEVGYISADADPWPGSIAFYRSPGDSGYVLNTVAELQATYGATTFDFYSGPLHRYDRSNTLRVTLARGELSSLDEDALLAGGNLACVKNADGEWELLQFASAILVAPSTYDLTGLLRGQFGTEGAMRDPVAAGASFMLIDEAVTAVDMSRDEIGLTYNWRYGPPDDTIDSISYRTQSHDFAGLGLRPYRPVHLSGRRDAVTGDWTFGWIRRTRSGGDGWDGVDVPLAEESELYQLEVMNGLSAVRTVTPLGTPSYTYAAADQIADFGSPQWNVVIRVAQVSAFHGAGPKAEALVFV